MNIDRLTEADIPAALRLSTQAGWNQLEADWVRLVKLWPDFCFAGRVDGQVVATSTVACYGSALGWIGMVLVDESMRGRGCGTAILDAAIEAGDRAGIKVLGLDATDLGQPLYLKRGFVPGVRVIRWTRGARKGSTSPAKFSRPVDLHQIAALGVALTGVDRASLLRHLSTETDVRCATNEENGTLAGFGFRRPGRTADHLGPIVARTSESAIAILNELLSSPRVSPLIMDVPESAALDAWLESNGFTRSRMLVRMCRPAAKPFNDARHTYALSGFELG